jgi:hypothetical protein
MTDEMARTPNADRRAAKLKGRSEETGRLVKKRKVSRVTRFQHSFSLPASTLPRTLRAWRTNWKKTP